MAKSPKRITDVIFLSIGLTVFVGGLAMVLGVAFMRLEKPSEPFEPHPGAEKVSELRPGAGPVNYDPSRLMGSPDAPVMVVEFTDFQCPYCRSAAPVVKGVLAKYPDRVSLAVRDFPLGKIHPQAQIAAEASRCAAEQGKFWEYYDLLLAERSNMEMDSLVAKARGLGLDTELFGSCLRTGKYRDRVEKDRQEGIKAGVEGTPYFFINRVRLDGFLPAADFERIIETELARAGSKGPAP
jgi:protein-disulfide isomerase